jgi:Kef-type K+ transport system membrane component KefB
VKKIIRQLYAELRVFQKSPDSNFFSVFARGPFNALGVLSLIIWADLLMVALIIYNYTSVNLAMVFDDTALNFIILALAFLLIGGALYLFLKPLEKTANETPKSKHSQTLIIFGYISVMLFAIAMLTLKKP